MMGLLLFVKEKNPLLFQIGAYMRDYWKLTQSKKYVDSFHKLNVNELKILDADMYEKRQHKKLDWNNLKTYTEKMQWAKIFDRDPRKTMCADKYAVRKWVIERIGENYLVPLLGVWDDFKSIDFSSLPNQFVIKTNHGSSDAVVVKDKGKIGLAKKIEIRRKITISMKTDYSTKHCEMHYADINPKIIVEELLVEEGNDELSDYKFLCFDGTPYYCWVDKNRYTNHTRNVYDLDWNLQSWNQCSYGNYAEEIPKPQNFEEMISVARALSKGFSHVRVDLYNIQGKIYFSEMTFTNGSGFAEIVPAEADLMLGDLWNLKSSVKYKV